MTARFVTLVLVLAGSAACAQSGTSSMNATATSRAGWRSLFDGLTTTGWRGFRLDTAPGGWQVIDGVLTRVDGGGDIITVEQFAIFELELEWNVAPGRNSGIMFRVTQDSDATYKSGPEMQVLDESQVSQFLVAAEGSPYQALYYLAVTTGMRQGELFGLKWTDLQWNSGTLHIQRQVQRVNGQGKNFVEPKTLSGRRTIT